VAGGLWSGVCGRGSVVVCCGMRSEVTGFHSIRTGSTTCPKPPTGLKEFSANAPLGTTSAGTSPRCQRLLRVCTGRIRKKSPLVPTRDSVVYPVFLRIGSVTSRVACCLAVRTLFAWIEKFHTGRNLSVDRSKPPSYSWFRAFRAVNPFSTRKRRCRVH